ncbi:hypothetical protein ACQ86N_40330 [Puia sp. P3]|uniref:hypothetical protein n=1 Tax=Puia sp. P3 TaxID=3423952 RepID=UPI003D670405
MEKLGAWGTRSSAELAAAEEKLASISPELERLGASGRSLESELQQAKNDYAALQARFEEQLVSSTHLTEQAEVLQRRIDTLTREKEIQDRSIQQYYRSNYDLKRQLQKLQDEQGARKETESHRLYKLEAEKRARDKAPGYLFIRRLPASFHLLQVQGKISAG